MSLLSSIKILQSSLQDPTLLPRETRGSWPAEPEAHLHWALRSISLAAAYCCESIPMSPAPEATETSKAFHVSACCGRHPADGRPLIIKQQSQEEVAGNLWLTVADQVRARGQRGKERDSWDEMNHQGERNRDVRGQGSPFFSHSEE